MMIAISGWLAAVILFVIAFRLGEDKRDAQKEIARYRMALKEERAAHLFDNRMHQNVYETNMQLNYDGARQQGVIDWQKELLDRLKQSAEKAPSAARELPGRKPNGQFTTEGMKTSEKQLLAAVLKDRGLTEQEISSMLQIKSVATYVSAGKKLLRNDSRFWGDPVRGEDELLLSHGIVLQKPETDKMPI